MYDLDELFRRSGLELCGSWHVRPPSSDTMPSCTDVDHIGAVLDMREEWKAQTARALLLIYAPRRLTYGYAGLTAESWIFRQGESVTGRVMAQPEPSTLVSKGRY